MKNVLLICGSFTSANFHVMLAVIRSLGDVHIDAISANNETELNLPQYGDVTYHHVYNWRKSFVDSLQRIPNKFISKSIDYLFYKTTALYDTFVTSPFERKIHRECRNIIKEKNIDAIFSVCLRFYTHRIASKLSNETGLKWYQFWLDPYSNKNEGCKVWRKAEERVEKGFLESTDRVYALPEVFVGSQLIEHYRDKLITFQIPYLIEREVSQKTKNIIFAGAFIKRVRDPFPVLNLLSSISVEDLDPTICFHFYVSKKEDYISYTEQSSGRIQFHDYVDHDELYRLLSESFMLLNIGNAGSIQMPSKTVEYVSFRKPILFFYKDLHDPSLPYLTEYPDICRINVDEDSDNNRQILINFIKGEHPAISYSDLIKVSAYRESTPDYIKQVLKDENKNYTTA